MTEERKREEHMVLERKVQEEKKKQDTNALGNPMRGIEDMVEQNDNQLDGIINNIPKDEAAEKRVEESVIKKLKCCAKNPEEKPPRKICPDRELC